MKVDPMLGGQWKIPCLVVNGRFHAWWSMEDPMLGGQWKIPCLVVNGRSHVWWLMEDPMPGGPWNVKENTFSPLPIPPNHFTLNLQFFPLALRLYFTMVLNRYSHLSFLFFDL
jgi:hypothetical protein